jgi:hypothetical protein
MTILGGDEGEPTTTSASTTTTAATKCGFFPFDKLRVRMTALRVGVEASG